jgi:hypothetical protein
VKAAVVFEGNIVVNVMVSESIESARSFLKLLYPDNHESYSVLDVEEHNIAGVGCQLIDGVWEEPYSIPVLGWEYIRDKVKELLAYSDWTQLADAQLTSEKKQEWVEYRQALRDLTQSASKPKDVVFPEAPTK